MIVYRYDTNNAKIVVHDLEVDNKTELKQSIKGEDVIVSQFVKEGTKLNLQIGDFIEFKGTEYTILDEPEVKKEKNSFSYRIEFKSDLYYLKNVMVINPDTNELEFSLFGNAIDMISVIINNMNRVYSTGAIYFADYIEETESKLITFNQENCLAAIQRLAKEFDCEFKVLGKQITFRKKIGQERNLIFRYSKELKAIERVNTSDSELVTRLYVFGSTRNISTDYGEPRLSINPIENNVDIFGVIERSITFEDIYPRLNGVVSTEGSDIYHFVSTGIDFDVNNQLLPGVTAKVFFNTGDLAGREFDLINYNHATKTVEIGLSDDGTGLELPSSIFKPRVGDKFVLLGIKMPDSYILAAEAELLEKGLEYIGVNSQPNVMYKIKPHYPALRASQLDLQLGDIITVEDEDFGITIQTRILSLQQKLSNPYDYDLEIGNKISINYITQVLNQQKEIRNAIYFRDKYLTEKYDRVYNNVKDFVMPVYVNRGEFSEDEYYYNNQNVIDYVYILDGDGKKLWYVYTGQDHARGAWNLANWRFIGDHFDIIATQVLLAENANIGGWIIQNQQIVSQAMGWENEANAQLNGLKGYIRFIRAISVEGDGGFHTYKQTVTVGGNTDGFTAERDADVYQTNAYTEVSSDGVRAEFAGQSASYPPVGSSGRAAIVGIGESIRSAPYSWIAGVVGWAQNLSESLSKAPYFGGIFWKLKSYGTYRHVEKLYGSVFYCTEHTDVVACYNTSPTTVYLPENPDQGMTIEIRRLNADVRVRTYNGANNLATSSVRNNMGIKKGDGLKVTWDGTNWLASIYMYYNV